MTLEPTPAPARRTIGDSYADYYRQRYEDAQRQDDFNSAARAKEIGLKFDAVKILVDRLAADLDQVPLPSEVRQLTGASQHAAEAFADSLKGVVREAGAAAGAIRLSLDTFSENVLKTIVELAEFNNESSDLLDQARAQLEQYSVPPAGGSSGAPATKPRAGTPNSAASQTPAPTSSTPRNAK